MQSAPEIRPSWSLSFPTFDWEKILFGLILVLAVLTRFYKLEPRVMSHDENSHVYYSWLLYEGQGYQHDPITHGPFQFHIVALSYFLFGATDTTARIPSVLFSIATVAFMWFFRKYLGRAGAMVAAILFLISPYMLYYGRYVRNESFVALFGVMAIWATLAYLETGKLRYILWLTAATVLHFTAKETSYIYTAQLLLFLGSYFIYRVTSAPWVIKAYRTYFLLSLMGVVLMAGVAILPIFEVFKERKAEADSAIPTVGGQIPGISPALFWAIVILLILAIAALIAAMYFLQKGYSLEKLRQERSFDLIIVLGTLVLPLLAAFPLKLVGWPVPTNASSVNAMNSESIFHMGFVVILMMIPAIVIGLWWNRRWWLVTAGLFYGIFTFLYTTYFTNTDGFFTGLLGSLGYWMAQQSVQRGTQPWYYYIFIQVPIYEYLPAIATLLGLILLFRQRRKHPAPQPAPIEEREASVSIPEDILSTDESQSERSESAPTVALLVFWVISSLVAYSYAGEKMPWLTVHIALPLIMFGAWTIGRLIDTTDWQTFREYHGPQISLLLTILVLCLATCFGLLFSTTPPLRGNSQAALFATGAFVVALVVAMVCLWGLGKLRNGWLTSQLNRLAVLIIFGLLGVLTARTAFVASYINYDRPLEYLVYAHCATGVKEALGQIEDLSRRTTDGLYLKVAYDNETSYPYWWYLRDYPNAFGFGSSPTFELRNYPAILVGDANYSKIDPVVSDEYFYFDYIRIWWPNEDYKRITWGSIESERKAEWAAHPDPLTTQSKMTVFDYLGQVWKKHIGPFFTDSHVREAIWQIWFNRDYTQYAALSERTEFTLPTWSPSGRMRLYIRKDIASQLWDYGIPESARVEKPDPYAGKQENLQADLVVGSLGNGEGQFQLPRDIALAPDGSVYVADTFNNRVQHLSADGTFIQEWGSQSPDCPYPGSPPSDVPAGTFCEPWGIAVGGDGSVYVADTWNNRIQKFSPDGQFLTMWGHGISQDLTDLLGFYGPRGIVVDTLGNVLVTDTGNSRVVVFSTKGDPITQFGSEGISPGQFSEPVGIALDATGRLYVVDTWNRRVQIFTSDGIGGGYTPTTSWEVSGWETTSVNNKPFITIDLQGHVFITDPDGYRVIEFSSTGDIVRYWGNIGVDYGSFDLPTGIVADLQGGVWVVDSSNNRLMHFTLPK
jgi:predicted membrane-bound mannosyltransferase/DNA-binding beta-propeller fold protein YncE